MALRRVPSRRMPAAMQEPLGFRSWLFAGVLLGILVALCWCIPSFGVLILLATIAVCITSLCDRCRKKRQRKSRRHDSICTFARSFERRSVDTWVVRAAWDALTEYTDVPIRAGDRFEADFGIDPEELEYLAEYIAARAGRTRPAVDADPLMGKVITVSDLVEFLAHQPSLPTS